MKKNGLLVISAFIVLTLLILYTSNYRQKEKVFQSRGACINRNNKIEKVKNAMLSMQRYSWEQGVAVRALMEMGETELVIQLAKEAGR